MSRDRSVIEKVIASLKNIGQFEITPLREGAHGATFRAVDPKRRISVAIRTVWPGDFPNGDEVARRLLTQSRTAQTIDHGNLAKVIGSGELDRAFFMVTAFSEGRSLRQNLLSGEHLNTWDLIDFARQSCVGLEFAHGRGVFHHALHPENVVLEFDGATKVLDIGLYRSNVPTQDEFYPNAVYLAPEQLFGAPPDAAANFYSVALMLYEIATGGRLPYSGDNWQELSTNAQSEFPAPIDLNPNVPPGINAVIMKALARDRGSRYANGPELVRALEDYKSFGRQVTFTQPKPVAPKPVVAAAPAPAANAAVSPAPVPPSLANATLTLSPIGVKAPPPPPPAPPVEPEPEPLPPPPTKVEVARKKLEPVAKAAVTQAKKIDPWVAALSALVLIVVIFMGRTLYLSFSTPHSRSAELSEPVSAPDTTPPTQPQAAQPLTNAEPSTVTNSAAAPAETPVAAQPVPVQSTAAQPATAKQATKANPRDARKRTGPTAFDKNHPLPPSGTLPGTGSLEISTTPAGARVTIDGKQTLTAPQVVQALSPGVHTLTIAADGYTATSRTVQITAGAESHLSVQLEQPNGFVTVLSNPPGAYVLIDGNNTNRQTPAQIQIGPGTHSLTLRKLGYLEASDSFSMKSGEQVSRNVKLLEAGSTPEIKVAQTGGIKKMFGNKVSGTRVSIRTTPPGASVTMNSQLVPKSTPVEFGLNPGSYVMQIQLNGYQTVQKTITVEAGKPLSFDETLHP